MIERYSLPEAEYEAFITGASRWRQHYEKAEQHCMKAEAAMLHRKSESMDFSLRIEEKGETARDYPATLLPEMSLRKALSSRFRLDQITYTVSTYPGAVFRRLVRECGQISRKNSNWRPIQQENLLRLLETDCSDVARWYSINLLLEHKVAVPLEISEAARSCFGQ